MKKILSVTLTALLAFSSISIDKAKAEYPFDRPLNIVVSFGPGGSFDLAARILSDYFLEKNGMNINVINRPGGAQAIGMNEVLKSRPDGYTVGFVGTAVFATTPKLSNVGYDLSSVKPICQISTVPSTIAVHKDSGIKTFDEFIEKAKADLKNAVYATTGPASYHRMIVEKVLQRFYDGYKLRHIAYTSNHEVSTALLGKHIVMGVSDPASVAPYVKSGDFVALMVGGEKRHPEIPDVPTIAEVFADKKTTEDDSWIHLSTWGGLVASKKVSDDKIKILETMFKEALEDPKVIEKLKKVNVDVSYLNSKEFLEEIVRSSDMADQLLNGRKSLD